MNIENAWKLTPINLAMMKSRRLCVKKLLSQEGVQVNCKDDSGRSLLSVMLFQIDDQTEDFIKQVLSLGGDPNLKDFEDSTSLHHLAKYYQKSKAAIDANTEKHLIFERIGRIAKQLIDAGADLSI